ncbi:EsaB/YukD family protein [Streptomyces sp. NBC_01136]|uniref:EsaB/YukD family protein n=1 Tax=unclassified Streptomyces TaxID=2593676 RepID=UPI00324B693E|nr:EsaB/YukD family protein [Streptomyces sp. NBC_01136]
MTSTDATRALVGGDLRCRVTVVGRHRRADLALPARTPLAEYMAAVGALLGESEDELLPPAWSMAIAGQRPLPLSESLADAGVADGTVLHLRDVLAGEADEPVVLDLEEEVAAAAARFSDRPWNRRHRAMAGAVTGAAWLTAALIAGGVAAPLGDSVPVCALAAAVALIGIALAWAARVRDWPVPSPLRHVSALLAVPALCVAGERLGSLQHQSGAALPNAVLGAAAGGVLVFLALPGLTTGALCATGTLAFLTTAVLRALHADAVRAAGFVAVLCLALYLITPWAADRVVVHSTSRSRLESADASTVEFLVRRSHRLTLGASAFLCALTVGCLVVLGRAQDPYALGLSSCVSVALLLRAGGFRLVTEALPAVTAAGTGLFTLLFELPARLHTPWWCGLLATALTGLVLLLGGLGGTARGPLPDRTRPAWHGTLEFLCSTAALALAVGAFGVYTHLAHL